MTGFVSPDEVSVDMLAVKPTKVPNRDFHPATENYLNDSALVQEDFLDDNNSDDDKSGSGSCDSPDSLSPLSTRPYHLDEDGDESPREETDLSDLHSKLLDDGEEVYPGYSDQFDSAIQSDGGFYAEESRLNSTEENVATSQPCIPKVWSFESALDTTPLLVIPEEVQSEGSDGEWCEAVSSGFSDDYTTGMDEDLGYGRSPSLRNRRFRSAASREWIRRGKSHQRRQRIAALELAAQDDSLSSRGQTSAYLRYTLEFIAMCILGMCAAPILLPILFIVFMCVAPLLVCCGAPLMCGMLWFNRKFRRTMREYCPTFG